MNDRITALQALKNLKEQALALYPIGDARKAEAKEWIKIIERELTEVEYKPTPYGDDWLSPKEIADEFGYTRSSIYTYISIYDIETKKERGRRYINLESFKEFLIQTGRW